MKKNQLIIVSKEVPETIIAQAKLEYPDHEIIVVENLEEWKKQKAQFEQLPAPITRIPLEDMHYMPSLKAVDMQSNNPWPSSHSSYKNKKKRRY